MATKKMSAAPDSTPASFEAALAELETLVERMEGGDLPLEASLVAYERGTLLRRFCEAKLADAEQQVAILEGHALKPFAPANAAVGALNHD